MTTITPEIRASWPKPNYESSENHHVLLAGIAVPGLVLSITFVAVRFYGKGVLRHVLGLDDWLMLGALMLAIPISTFALAAPFYGLGMHIWDQNPVWYGPYAKMMFVTDLLFPSAVSLTKVSLCFTYLRLFPSRADKIFCYGVSTFIVLFTVASFFLSLFQCTPIKGYWDTSVVPTCINMRVVLVTMAGLNTFSDLLVYLWPAKPLWSLQLPLKRRLGLIFLFSVGLSVCVAGISRMYFIEQFFNSYDAQWICIPVWVTMLIELNVGIVCGCLSGVKPVIATIFPALFGSSYKTKSATRPTYDGRTGRSGRHESFAFQEISSSKVRDRQAEKADIEDMPNPDGKTRRNFAWASSDGVANETNQIPLNKIEVKEEIIVEEDHSGSITPTSGMPRKMSDAGSEEWIFNDNKSASDTRQA